MSQQMTPIITWTQAANSREWLLNRLAVLDKRERRSMPNDETSACSQPGCESPIEGRGLCARHYQRLMKLRHSCSIEDVAPDWQNAAEVEPSNREIYAVETIIINMSRTHPGRWREIARAVLIEAANVRARGKRIAERAG